MFEIIELFNYKYNLKKGKIIINIELSSIIKFKVRPCHYNILQNDKQSSLNDLDD